MLASRISVMNSVAQLCSEFAADVSEDLTAPQAAVANMPGAFGRWTTFNMLNWVVEKGYEGHEPFQKYHARKFEEQNG
jgi:hypothetical protein